MPESGTREERLAEAEARAETLPFRLGEVEQSLRGEEYHRFVDDLVSVVPGMLYVFDLRQRRNVFVNRQTCTLLGYTEDEIRALAPDHFQLLHPDDLAAAQERLERLADLPDGAMSEIECRLRHGDGSWRWFLCRDVAYRRAPDGRVCQVIGVATDITQRKRVEEDLHRTKETLKRLNESLEQQVADRTAELHRQSRRLQAILDISFSAILTTDPHGVIQSVNPRTEELFGYAAEEMIGRNLNALLVSPYRGQYDPWPGDPGRNDILWFLGGTRELNARRKDGVLFPVLLTVSEIPELELYAGVLMDISRQRDLEREVVEIASQEQRRIGEDLHDTVGQELTGLLLMVESLRANPAAGPILIERIGQGLRLCQKELRILLRGLLPVSVDHEGLMAALADLADRTQQEGGAACTFDCPRPVALADNFTATQLYLIAKEAVHNAVKHARPRHIRMTLESDDRLLLSVRDDGTGMPVQPREHQGGVGLRIMRNRAAILGALLTIEPAQPTGTVMTCSLARTRHE
jgi:PAS domain S-box-containing protein